MVQLRSFLFLFLLCAIACGDDDMTAFDGGPDGSAPDVSVSCTTDNECSDGLFCNGVETCSEGVCVAGETIACDDGLACTIDACNEIADQCESMPPDADEDGVGDMACLDADGQPLGRDCDDADPRRFGGNLELCDADGIDEDCDPTTFGTVDNDGDGYIDAECRNVDSAGAMVSGGDDCNDGRADVQPLAAELCDHVDNNCNGEVDEGVTVMIAPDADRDGFPADGAATMECPGFAGQIAIDEDTVFDCDDNNRARNPGQVEVCDEEDNDCDDTADENAEIVSWYRDNDGDGFGSAESGIVRSCDPVAGASLLATDCNDLVAGINPAAAEACNAIDDDCNGRADFEISPGDFEDDDGDAAADAMCGGVRGTDCNDNDARTSAGTAESCDGRDNDCDDLIDEGANDSIWFFDGDGDGHGTDSNPLNPPVRACSPPSTHVGSSGDCDDTSADRNPDATESCNRVDDDCDGVFDEAPAVCICAGDTFDCNGNGACDTDLSTDDANCGRCGVACGAGQSCVNGACACDGGGSDIACGGVCVDATNDETHCGACDNSCGIVSECELGSCGGIRYMIAGDGHTCALMDSGRLACWGDNSSGQVVPGSDTAANPFYGTAQEIVLGDTIEEVAVGDNFTCAVVFDTGTRFVRCWGDNTYGQIGFAIGTQPPDGLGSVVVPGSIRDLQLGRGFGCLVSEDIKSPPRTYCWGRNHRGQLGGDPSNMDSSAPIMVQESGGFGIDGDQVTLGADFACGYQNGGFQARFWCWGANDSDQIGSGAFTGSESPLGIMNTLFPIGFGSGPAIFSAGRAHVCATTAGEFFCWGDNNAMQLDPDVAFMTIPDPRPELPPVVPMHVESDGDRVCILGRDGSVWCRGEAAGGLATGGTWVRAPIGQVQSLTCGPAHCCVVSADDHAYCFGNGADGRLGNGVDTNATFMPSLVSELTP